jgi:hypothetical protein
MKIKGIKKFIVGVGLLSAAPAFGALELAQDKVIKIERADKSVSLRAFPTSESCKTWYYIPGKLTATGEFRSLFQAAEAKVEDPQNSMALVSNLILTAEHTITQADRDQLLEAIMKFAANNPSFCRATMPAKKEDVLVMPADVKVRAMPLVSEGDRDSGSFTQAFSGVYPTHSAGSAWESSIDRRSITLVTDLSYPDAYNDLKDLVSSKEPTTVGKISMVLNGIVSHVKADLTIKANMKAEFHSQLERVSCKETKTEGGKSDPVVDGIILTHSPGAYVAKRLMDQWFPNRSKTTVCTDQLTTTFKGGDVTGFFEFNSYDTKFNDEDGKPIMVVPCSDRGECENAIPLEQFLKFELLTLYLQTNFSAIVNTVGDRTYEVTLGKRGTVESRVNIDGRYRRVLHGRVVKAIPVVVENLKAESFKTRFLNDSLYQCAVGNDEESGRARYWLQTQKYAKFIRTSPMPVAPACFRGSPRRML